MNNINTSSIVLKLITFVLIVVHMGIGSISIAYLFIDSNSHLIEYCDTVENESLMDELEKEIDDKFNIVFLDLKQSIRITFDSLITSKTPLTEACSDICTPPPELS